MLFLLLFLCFTYCKSLRWRQHTNLSWPNCLGTVKIKSDLSDSLRVGSLLNIIYLIKQVSVCFSFWIHILSYGKFKTLKLSWIIRSPCVLARHREFETTEPYDFVGILVIFKPRKENIVAKFLYNFFHIFQTKSLFTAIGLTILLVRLSFIAVKTFSIKQKRLWLNKNKIPRFEFTKKLDRVNKKMNSKVCYLLNISNTGIFE